QTSAISIVIGFVFVDPEQGQRLHSVLPNFGVKGQGIFVGQIGVVVVAHITIHPIGIVGVFVATLRSIGIIELLVIAFIFPHTSYRTESQSFQDFDAGVQVCIQHVVLVNLVLIFQVDKRVDP